MSQNIFGISTQGLQKPCVIEKNIGRIWLLAFKFLKLHILVKSDATSLLKGRWEIVSLLKPN